MAARNGRKGACKMHKRMNDFDSLSPGLKGVTDFSFLFNEQIESDAQRSARGGKGGEGKKAKRRRGSKKEREKEEKERKRRAKRPRRAVVFGVVQSLRSSTTQVATGTCSGTANILRPICKGPQRWASPI